MYQATIFRESFIISREFHFLWQKFVVFNLEGNYLFKVELSEFGGSRGLFREIRINEFGILAYSLDPEDGYQKLYILELE